MTLVQLRVVMAGLDPAIHVLVTGTGDAGNRVDARVKPAHDDLQFVPIRTQQPILVPRTALRAFGEAPRGVSGFSSRRGACIRKVATHGLFCVIIAATEEVGRWARSK